MRSKPESEIMDLVKKNNLPPKESDNWSEDLLSFILSRLSEGNKQGTAYAEANSSSGPVDFKVTQGREKALSKGYEAKTIAQFGGQSLNRFVSYLLRTVLGKSRGGVGAGVFTVRFKDEIDQRVYCLYARRSGALGDCFQIDEINHL